MSLRTKVYRKLAQNLLKFHCWPGGDLRVSSAVHILQMTLAFYSSTTAYKSCHQFWRNPQQYENFPCVSIFHFCKGNKNSFSVMGQYKTTREKHHDRLVIINIIIIIIIISISVSVAFLNA